MTILPVELIERVIDFVAEDSSTLKECALTNSVFLPRCRVHRFRTIVLHQPSAIFRFQELIEATPHIASLTTGLVFVVLDIQDYATLRPCILEIFDRLPNMCKLSIRPPASKALSWFLLRPSTQDLLIMAFSRPGITFISWDYVLSAPDVYSFLPHCAGNKLWRLKMHSLPSRLTRASSSDDTVKIYRLALHDPQADPNYLVPETLPLLDLSRLTSLYFKHRTHTLTSHEWIKAITKHCFHTLHSFVWIPSHVDVDSGNADICPLSELPALQRLHIDTRHSLTITRPALFLRQLLKTRSAGHVLKTLRIQHKYQQRLAVQYYMFVLSMKDFLQGLTDVEYTLLAVSCTTMPLKSLSKESGLGGEYPGTTCVLEVFNDRR